LEMDTKILIGFIKAEVFELCRLTNGNGE